MMKKFSYKDVYLIAEIGGNHEGDFEYAKDLCQLAIDSDADCIKFQTYYADGFVNPKYSIERYNHFKKFELPLDNHFELADMCISAGKDYLSSVWNFELLSEFNKKMNFFKIGSGDFTAYKYIQEISKFKKPIILSTGLSNSSEVDKTVQFLKDLDPFYEIPENIVVMQCTSSYPLGDSETNLSVIETYKQKYNILPGYSDHTMGMEALFASIFFGARVLEFHFTDTREGKTFRDHSISLTKEETKVLKQRINRGLDFIGSPDKKLQNEEEKSENIFTFRRGIYPSRDLPKGTEISEDMLICLRPNQGISADKYFSLIGQKLKRSISKLEAIKEDDLIDE